MANFNKRVQSDNSNLNNLTSAKFAHVIASSTVTVKDAPGRLLRVILNTNGGVVTVRNGSEVIASIAADAPEGTFNFGVYCNSSIIVESGSTVDATIVFA